MKFNILKTRVGKLETNIKNELGKPIVNLETIMTHINEYEKNNLATIEKLKRSKKIETNRINGALRSTISAHGAITKSLCGSATKRIYGALLSNEKSKSKFDNLIKNIFNWFN